MSGVTSTTDYWHQRQRSMEPGRAILEAWCRVQLEESELRARSRRMQELKQKPAVSRTLQPALRST
jgi:hypothetical protein